jgi:hypothetical protein
MSTIGYRELFRGNAAFRNLWYGMAFLTAIPALLWSLWLFRRPESI